MNSSSTNNLIRVNPLTKSIFRHISIKKYEELKIIREANNIDLFETIRIETRTRCNGRCNFCPTSIQHETRSDVKMTVECFKKIVDELAYIKFDGFIQMYINNEPLIDKRLVEFLGYIKSKNLNTKWVCISTNGLALNIKLGTELFENGLTWLIVNDYSTDGSPSKKLADVVANLREQFPDRRIDFYDRTINEVLGNRTSISPNNPIKVSLDAACVYPLRQMNITANGDVGLCCQDVHVRTPLGNVLQNSLTEIWNGSLYTTFRENISKGDRKKHELCKYCDYVGYSSGTENRKLIYSGMKKLGELLLERQKRKMRRNILSLG